MLVYSNLSIETHEAAFLSYSDMQVSIFNIPSLQPGPARWPRFLTRLIMSENRKMPYNAEKAENARTNL